MVILSNSKYNELVNEIRDYEVTLDNQSDKITNLRVENYKLKNKIKSYKDNNNKNDNKIREKLLLFIMEKLESFDISADELDKLVRIYFDLEENLDGDSNEK